MSFSKRYIDQSIEICQSIDIETIETIAQALADLRNRKGRLFFIGSGGGAGHSSHAVNDFRKIANIEAYTPTDNVSELTARINDDGWESSYLNWLKVSRFSKKDALFVFSVGGGNREKNRWYYGYSSLHSKFLHTFGRIYCWGYLRFEG